MVTIPEALGVYQARRLVVEFARHGLDIHNLVINNVVFHADCEFHRLRKNMQREYIDMLVNDYQDHIGLTQLPLLPYEVKGIERLRELEKLLFDHQSVTAH